MSQAAVREIPHAVAGRPSRARLAALNAVSGVALRALPRIPDPVKRVLLGRRRVSVDGNTLDTTLQLMLTMQKASGLSGLVASDDIAVARNQLRSLAGAIDAPIIVASNDITVTGAAGPLRARHYAPAAPDGAPLLVFYHGGGFTVGDITTHDALCRLLCRDGAAHVISVDYRLAPEHEAPAAVDDAYAAYRWALDHAADLGADPLRVAVGGDSAGGNLAAVVSMLARDDRAQLPALQLLFYPVVYSFHGDTRSKGLFSDGFFLTRSDMDWFERLYLDGASIDTADPRISPLLADDLSGLPPALVVTAGFDPLRDEGDSYAEALVAAGVAVDHRRYGTLVHGFANFFPLGGDSETATLEVVSAVRAHLTRA
ncbi:alpha/beta hydrolase [Mycolicibacterium arenosum]|uniref:Alpha/beta hydrolase n=1 Tax=Mycolicibacterium arenosum TaxID=2952157 RepID=A0ABT1M6W5_9MYCO|nr:alpha/beta hydrolase [Mycolicibacterium sp. CAU 1645]MCP9274305.1 alpha/beta hydrolase [Mycolicibacterium sp. CAU 1645]